MTDDHRKGRPLDTGETPVLRGESFFNGLLRLSKNPRLEIVEKHPVERLRRRGRPEDRVGRIPILKAGQRVAGQPKGGVPEVRNSELEKAFGVTMSTIYKRAWEVRRLLGLADV